MTSLFSLVALVLCTLAGVAHVHAHRPSDAYLVLESADSGLLRGYWEIALRDLDQMYALDDGDGQLRWRELRAQESRLLPDLARTLRFQRANKDCLTQLTALSIVEHSDGSYAHVPLQIHCPQADAALQITYDFMNGVDATHRALLRLLSQSSEQKLVLRAGETFSVPMVPASTSGHALLRDITSGTLHILAGLDHVLFLIVLLLPAVLRRERAGFVPATSLRPVLRDVVQVVSAFTVAHSLTLSLSALGVVHAASSVIEPAIAASVVFAAANNVVPLMPYDRWAPAFVLGLLHGFGFSSALADAGLAEDALLRALVGFNVGVELGQLCIVALFVPLAFLLRNRAAYRRYALGLGSYAVAAVALFWFFDRLQGS